MTKFIAYFALLLFAQDLISQNTPSPPDLLNSQLLSAQDILIFPNKKLYLEASVWIDHMPTFPMSGSSSLAAIFVKTKDKSPVPTNLTADAIWIISKNKSWKSWLPKESSYPAYDKPEEIQRVVSCHTFPPETLVDVIVRLKDHKGREYFLKASDLLVKTTY